MLRTIARRTIWATGSEISTNAHAVDLALVAHAAAIETLQIDLVARGWVGLFGALLVPGPPGSDMIWRNNGPGGEAEIKRAYSALFGRFFGRAILRHEHGCLDLRQIHDELDLASGLRIRRQRAVSGRGDLPDWVGWNVHSNCYSICEAKGSHDQGDWAVRVPPVVHAALAQTNRMEVVDATGVRIATKNWVVASRWGTSQNGKTPTMITLDPLTAGRGLSETEVETLPREAHARFIADLLIGLGRSDLAGEGGALSLGPAVSFAQDTVAVGGREGYAAVLVDGSGVFPLRGTQWRQRFRALREISEEMGRKIAIVLLEKATVQAARDRESRPQNRETSITEEGQTVSSDGVTITWNVDALDVNSSS